MSRIAFKQEELKDAKKDFVGQIIATDYAENPFGMVGAAEIKRTGPVLCIQIRTEAYEKDQYEWYPPSDKKMTKWAYFLETLTKVGAMHDITISGTNDEERMKSFAKSLIGMKARFIEMGFESMVKIAGEPKKFDLIVMEEYLGRAPVETAPEVRRAEVGAPEALGEPAAAATAEDLG